MFDNYNYVKKILPNFKENSHGRTEGTFTNFDSLDDKIDDLYYYMQYIKFGFGNEHLWHLYRTTADLYIKQERYEDAHSIATQVQNLIKQNGLNESTQQYIWTSKPQAFKDGPKGSKSNLFNYFVKNRLKFLK